MAAIILVAFQLSSISSLLAVLLPMGQGLSKQGVRALDWLVMIRKRREAPVSIEEEGQGRKRSHLNGKEEEDWYAAPVVFAQRPQNNINNTEYNGDAAVEGVVSGIGDIYIQGEDDNGYIGAEDR